MIASRRHLTKATKVPPRIPAEFSVHGPFRVPSRDKHIERTVQRTFWAASELTGLASERGCYVFALVKQGGGIKPLYVGQTRSDFKSECFDYHKLVLLNDGIRKQSGTLMLYLVKHEKGGRGRISGSDLTDLEHRLIGLAYKQNPELLNVKGTKGRPPAVNRGIDKPHRGSPSDAERDFKRLIGSR